MKKSRIIVPAMAVIAFSTAASIAGSVAWFTASRTVTIGGGSYAVVKVTSNLDATLAAGVGTTVNGNQVTFTGKLTDASFNHNLSGGKKFYIPNGLEGSAFALTEVSLDQSLANLTTALTRTTITVNTVTYVVYSAATFDITFDVDIGSGQPDVALFLDAASSSFTNTGDAKTAKGFRMAFVPKLGSATDFTTGSTGVSKVYADLQVASKCKYVAGTDNKNGTAYGTYDLVDSGYSTAVPSPTVDPDDLATNNSYIGTATKPATGHAKMTYTVVCWFEGTDEEIVNRDTDEEYQTVTANLSFTGVDVVESTTP